MTFKSSLIRAVNRFMRKPWEITEPCSDPEFRTALPMALEYRLQCPATIKEKPIVPTAAPEHVFDIKFFPRDQRRNRPPIRRTILRKPNVVKLMQETKFDDVFAFPPVYLTAKVEEDYNRGILAVINGVS